MTQLDLYCSIRVNSDLDFRNFVSFVEKCLDAEARMNSVCSESLDVSILENDTFDAAKSQIGDKRWLYFRYMLDVDPVDEVHEQEYIRAVGDLLNSIWSAGVDAVAACEFEEQLPSNIRRLSWALHERNGKHDAATSGDQMISLRQE